MSALLTWLLTNPTILAVIAGLVGALGWGWKQRRAGAASERARQAQARSDAIKDRKDIDDEVDSLGPADLDVRFRRWLQDNKR